MTTTKGRGVRSSRADAGDATRMAKALSHPIRTRIMARLNEAVRSPNELAKELGESLGTVSYHVRTLVELDCIELVDTQQRRGAIEHYYRSIQRAMGDEAVWEQMAPAARRQFAGEWFRVAFPDVAEAIDAGGFDQRADCHLTFTRLELDEQAWATLSERMDEVLAEALELQAETLGRAGGDGATGDVRTRLVLAQYEAAAGEDPPATT